MNGPAMIRAALVAAALLVASQAQAGQDVPPPRAIRPVQPLLAAAPPMGFAAQPRWRETPPVMQGWSDDRYVPVAGFGEMSACEARARAGVMAQDDVWDGEGDEFAAFDGDDFASGWEDMR